MYVIDTTAKRAPLPLRVVDGDICDAEGNEVAYGFYLPEDLPPDLIVRAVNAHDALVAALTDLASETRSACDARRFPSLTVALSEADAALALARS